MSLREYIKTDLLMSRIEVYLAILSINNLKGLIRIMSNLLMELMAI